MNSLNAFAVEQLAVVLAVGAAVLVVAVAAVRLSVRSGLPSLLLYLGIGVAIGEAGFGIPFESMGLSRVLGYVALILILAEGGLTTSWKEIRPSVAPAALLSTLGVLVSVLVVAVCAHQLLHLDWQVSLLLGAILSSTDAAAVFSVLRNAKPPPRLSGILEAESGFNDAPVVLVVVALSQRLASGGGAASFWEIGGLVVLELAGGALIGLAVGALGAAAMRHLGSSATGLFPIGVIAWVLLAYGAASLAHTSGFIAVYLAALVLGNVALPHRIATRGFAQALGWLAQIGLFVMLGLLVSPRELPAQFVPAIVLGLALLLLARPLSVIASTAWFGYRWRDQVFLSWAGLRGAVPIVLATVPVIAGVPNIEWVFDLVFVLVVVFTLVQGPTLPAVARLLGVADPERATSLDVAATPVEQIGADLLEIRIGAGSRLHGIEIFELRLPAGTDVALIVRDGAPFVPTPTTPLFRGDQLLVVTSAGHREPVEKRFHDVDVGGRLAGWAPADGKVVRARRPAPPHRYGTG